MTLINCPRCGKVFAKMRNPICDQCVREEEDLFQSVKKYLEANPNAEMSEVIQSTGASEKKIIRYFRDGRLEVTEGLAKEVNLSCHICGRPIVKGAFCDKCIIDMNLEVSDMKRADLLKKGKFKN